jgi:hypothetical protein
VQLRRDTKAAKRLLIRLLKKQGLAPKKIVTDKLRSYGAAKRDMIPAIEHRSYKGLNNSAENSHLPLRKRERLMQGFRSVGGLQRFISVPQSEIISSRRTRSTPPSLPTFIGSALWCSGRLRPGSNLSQRKELRTASVKQRDNAFCPFAEDSDKREPRKYGATTEAALPSVIVSLLDAPVEVNISDHLPYIFSTSRMIMAATHREYTPAEAAAVSGIAVKTVHNAIDKRIVSTATSRTGGRALTDDDLLHLKLWYGVGSIRSAERRKRLFDAIADDPAAETVRADDYLIVDVARARDQLAARADALREAEAAIHSVKGVAGGDAFSKAPAFRSVRSPA